MSEYEMNDCFNDGGYVMRLSFLEGGTGYDSLGSGLQILTYSDVVNSDCDSIMPSSFALTPAGVCVYNTIIECDDGTTDYTLYEDGQNCSSGSVTDKFTEQAIMCQPSDNNESFTQYCFDSGSGDDTISSSSSSTSLGSGAIAGITITVLLVVFGAVAVLLYYIYPSIFGLDKKTKDNVEMNRESINPMGNNLNAPLNA